ncbi:GTP cyclohydrolase II [Undibacterium sp. Jales W-56]|uniref:GTP cyclohydrolase II n=1 Tax=Undibacterium sp. Jales W-56 TaxID=2897325 RepID=UPI0021D128F1|nr:GTP cyclohydrolase II [Undibacterium sp. Jales W-56]MCU6435759.1 GTP cyclohydrolase II [Undibacterium sp. Jales W-56]
MPSNDAPVSRPDQALEYVTSCNLPTTWATFQMHAFVEPDTGKEHIALTLGDVANGEPVLARIHSECLTGDALFSLRCDCGPQLEMALQKIAQEGRGVLLYLRQEGRGIGLLNKVRAYHLQDQGADTVEANQQLGFAADLRNYSLCDPMLKHLGISSLKLMTNNPRKIAAMEGLKITVKEHIPLIIRRNPHNERYLSTKATKLGHLIQPEL